MEKKEKNAPVAGDISVPDAREEAVGDAEETLETEPRDGGERACTRRERIAKNAPRWAIYARYLLPPVMGVLLLVLSFLDGVYFYMNGRGYKMSLFAFYKNTLTSARSYLGGTTEAQTDWFYGLLSTGAIVGILVYLLAMFFAVLGAVTACRAFAAGHESEQSNRMKIIFKIAFSNRCALFFANMLFLVPVVFPEYFSAVGQHFMSIGGESTVFVESNLYFHLTAVYAGVLLALSLWMYVWELRKKMNMFLVWHPEDATESDDEEVEDDEEA